MSQNVKCVHLCSRVLIGWSNGYASRILHLALCTKRFPAMPIHRKTLNFRSCHLEAHHADEAEALVAAVEVEVLDRGEVRLSAERLPKNQLLII